MVSLNNLDEQIGALEGEEEEELEDMVWECARSFTTKSIEMHRACELKQVRESFNENRKPIQCEDDPVDEAKSSEGEVSKSKRTREKDHGGKPAEEAPKKKRKDSDSRNVSMGER